VRRPPRWLAAIPLAAGLAALALYLTVSARPESWTVAVAVTRVDDALSVMTQPCSAPRPGQQLIADRPNRDPRLRLVTVGPDRSIVLPGVTADTVITLQLINDAGTGGVRGTAIDARTRRPIFAFASPAIRAGLLERVWASSWYGDGRPAPLARGCGQGLDAGVARAAAPYVRPQDPRPFRPAAARQGRLLYASVALLALALAAGAWSYRFRRGL
jgi:hypothetical protein